jgi:uncharacterized protein (TIGR02300 family)
LANPELGAKQICPNCSAKFYDLTRRPAVCPKCGEAFDPEEAVRNRRVRARVATPDYEDTEEKEEAAPAPAEAEDGFEEEADETPEIDEAVEADVIETDDEDTEVDAGVPPPPADDDDAVPFLEEEDDDFPEDEIDVTPTDDDV